VLAAIGSFAILKVANAIVGLRVDASDETDGLDLSQHGESGYNLEDAMGASFLGSLGHGASAASPAASSSALQANRHS